MEIRPRMEHYDRDYNAQRHLHDLIAWAELAETEIKRLNAQILDNNNKEILAELHELVNDIDGKNISFSDVKSDINELISKAHANTKDLVRKKFDSTEGFTCDNTYGVCKSQCVRCKSNNTLSK
jgi:hypothetical protein